MVKVRVLIEDPGQRWQVGEEGILLVNNFDKYDYFVRLPEGKTDKPDPPFTREDGTYLRDFYFYANEVEVLGG